MKYLLLTVGLLVSVFSYAESAEACTPKHIGDACDTQRTQQARPDAVGRKAATPADMVCLTVLADSPSALVLARGRVREGEAVTGKVVTSWRMQSSMWKRTSVGYVREICMHAKKIAGTLTLCNDENRSIWSASDTSYLRQVKRIKASDPACLLGSKACGKLGL